MGKRNVGSGNPNAIDGVGRNAGAISDAWERTIEDTQSMVADRKKDGFETLLLPAGDTTPKNPSTGDTSEWGLSYIIPGDKADLFIEFNEDFEHDETIVYQNMQAGSMFIVIEHIDTDQKAALFIAGAYRLQFAPQMVRTAMNREEMYTHLKRLDGTAFATFEYNDPDKFFPNPEEFYAYESNK